MPVFIPGYPSSYPGTCRLTWVPVFLPSSLSSYLATCLFPQNSHAQVPPLKMTYIDIPFCCYFREIASVQHKTVDIMSTSTISNLKSAPSIGELQRYQPLSSFFLFLPFSSTLPFMCPKRMQYPQRTFPIAPISRGQSPDSIECWGKIKPPEGEERGIPHPSQKAGSGKSEVSNTSLSKERTEGNDH